MFSKFSKSFSPHSDASLQPGAPNTNEAAWGVPTMRRHPLALGVLRAVLPRAARRDGTAEAPHDELQSVPGAKTATAKGVDRGAESSGRRTQKN